MSSLVKGQLQLWIYLVHTFILVEDTFLFLSMQNMFLWDRPQNQNQKNRGAFGNSMQQFLIFKNGLYIIGFFTCNA